MILIGWIKEDITKFKSSVLWDNGNYIVTWHGIENKFCNIFDLKEWAKKNKLIYKERR